MKELEGRDRDTDRAVVKWTRPSEFTPGWTGSVAVLVSPIEPLRPFRTATVADPRIQWFSPAAKGQKLLFKVIFGEAGHTDISRVILPADRTLGPLRKKNGESVWLVLREDNLTLIELSKISDVIDNLKIHLRAGSSVDSVTDSRSLLVVAPDAPGMKDQPTVFDIALGKENIHIDVA
ncbi:MAG: hypothetical protein Q7T33_06095 [Dehalococcoidia bacterium]|nr:hypothetical protein [Dehalococcoidia bacterium]